MFPIIVFPAWLWLLNEKEEEDYFKPGRKPHKHEDILLLTSLIMITIAIISLIVIIIFAMISELYIVGLFMLGLPCFCFLMAYILLKIIE